MMWLALTTGTALAHYPHDAALYVALSPGDEPAWLITSVWRTEAWMIARTPNDQDVQTRFVTYGLGTFIGSGAMLDEERLVLGTEGTGLLVSDDAGDSFYVHDDIPADATVHQVLASPAVLADGVGLAVGLGGIWRTADHGETWSAVVDDTAFIEADLSPDFAEDGRACALTQDGDVWCSADAGVTWALAGSLGGHPWKVSVDEGQRLFVGDEFGLWRSEDGGESFEIVALEGTDVPVVEALGDDLVLAATLKQAAWRSDDGGETWELHSDDLEVPENGQGGPRKEEHYFEFRASGDGAIYLAAWEGVARSDDLGLTWQRVHTEHQQVIRDVDLTRGEGGRLKALLASYGGGVVLVDALEPTGQSISTEAPLRFLRNIAGSPDWAQDGVCMFAGAGKVYVTTDGAQTWFEGAAGEVDNIQKTAVSRNYGDAPLLTIAGTAAASIDLATSSDGGLTWEHGDVPRCGGAGSALSESWAWADDGAAWAACKDDGTVLQTLDRGATWQALGRTGSNVFTVAGAPDGQRVFAGAMDGLYAVDAGGSLERIAFEGMQVQGLAISPDWASDPTVFAVLASGGWWRSEDGGESWSDLPRPDDDYPLAVAVSPDFATDGIVAVSGYGGAWISANRGETWRWANIVERHENDSPQWIFTGDWDNTEAPDASGGRVQISSTEGDTAWFVFEGVAVDLVAPLSSDGGTLALRVDGAEAQTVSLQGEPVATTVAWSSGQLEEGWHRLDLEVTGGTVAVDAAQVWRQRPEETDTDTGTDTGEAASPQGPPATRCSCGASSAAGPWGVLWALPLLGLAQRRRNRGPRGP